MPVADHTSFELELRDVHVQVHPVDALDFQGDMVLEEVGELRSKS